jgi:hypothetical protein
VRCSACGFVAGDETFADGCPACGSGVRAAAGPERPARRREEPQPLPPWALFLSVGVCVFVLAALFVTLL